MTESEPTFLYWHDYRYFPYEKDLALREVRSLLRPKSLSLCSSGLRVTGPISPSSISRLVYFSAAKTEDQLLPTLQHRLETASARTRKQRRQITRYSVHGLHEYKGRFNPQVVRGILNGLGIRQGGPILDPFVGSGTTLVECTHVGTAAHGVDLNPLAVFLSNAKLTALSTPHDNLFRTYQTIARAYRESPKLRVSERRPSNRIDYLSRWFPPRTLASIEHLRELVLANGDSHAEVYIALASDLLRDYSLQEPSDLRIRRRRTPLPEMPFWEAFQRKASTFLADVAATQSVIGVPSPISRAYLGDTRSLSPSPALPLLQYEAAITSPPYATALPYIDTQRLSLVWTGLLDPSALPLLEAALTGSREMSPTERIQHTEPLEENSRHLPRPLHTFCLHLQAALSPADGFRRRAVPTLLYRYLADMRDCLASVLPLLATGAPFALIVGHNRTTLGDQPRDIDTPHLITDLALSVGFAHQETLSLQTYQRYGLNKANAVLGESLVLLRKP